MLWTFSGQVEVLDVLERDFGATVGAAKVCYPTFGALFARQTSAKSGRRLETAHIGNVTIRDTETEKPPNTRVAHLLLCSKPHFSSYSFQILKSFYMWVV